MSNFWLENSYDNSDSMWRQYVKLRWHSKNNPTQRLQKLDASAIKMNANAEVYLRYTWEQ